jgi:PAS domain S-box-containing protein
MSLEEIQGRYCYDIWTEREDVCPDCPVSKAMETGQFHEVEKWTPNGRVWYVQGLPVRDDEGKVVGAVEVTLDITERKRAEKALQESEQKFRILAEQSPNMIFINKGGKVVYANRRCEEVMGYKREEFYRSDFDFRMLIAPESREVIEAAFSKHMKGEDVAPYEYSVITKDGKRIVAINSSKLIPFEGETAILGVVTDITERKRSEAQLQQMQRLESIGTLAGGIAHDFNNILMGIQGNVSMMLLDVEEGDSHYERLKNLERQVQSGAKLTSHLLAYARKGKYEVKPFSLNQLVEDASDTFGRARREVTIHRHLSADAYAVEGDPGQIEQVLLNLFVNAAEAMPDGGDFILETMNVTHKDMTGRLYKPKQGNYVLLKVTDTGAGMDKETADRIFEPFFTTKEMGRGTGLGLASAYGIIKAHEGYIDVDSRKGRGTTFSIYLPASKKEAMKTARASERIVKGTETVLLADDEEVVRQAGKELLETIGYRVFVAKDGKEAVEFYKKKQDEIDIVLLDIVMPKTGGREAYGLLKNINPDVKVLLLSGYSIDGQAREILEQGANAFIQKPFTMKELSGKMREVLDKQ